MSRVAKVKCGKPALAAKASVGNLEDDDVPVGVIKIFHIGDNDSTFRAVRIYFPNCEFNSSKIELLKCVVLLENREESYFS